MIIESSGIVDTSPRSMLRRMLVCIAILLACSVFMQSLKYVFHLHFTAMNFLVFIFNADQERNIPTFFSVVLLLYATSLLYSIAVEKSASKDRYRLHWWLMAILFLLIAADEFMATHELISEMVREKYHVTGFLYYAWVIPFGILVLVLFIFYLGFLFKYLPAGIRNLMILSAVLYLGGSLFMEMVGSYFYLKNGDENMTNAILTTVEEGLELAGVALFIYSLLRYRQEMQKDGTTDITGSSIL